MARASPRAWSSAASESGSSTPSSSSTSMSLCRSKKNQGTPPEPARPAKVAGPNSGEWVCNGHYPQFYWGLLASAFLTKLPLHSLCFDRNRLAGVSTQKRVETTSHPRRAFVPADSVSVAPASSTLGPREPSARYRDCGRTHHRRLARQLGSCFSERHSFRCPRISTNRCPADQPC